MNEGDPQVKLLSHPRLWRMSCARLCFVGLATGIAVACRFALVTEPAIAQRKEPQENLVPISGSPTIGGDMMLGVAKAWGKHNKLPGVRVEDGIDPGDYAVVAEGAESARRIRVEVRTKTTLSGLEP